jgi:hypothetical protein
MPRQEISRAMVFRCNERELFSWFMSQADFPIMLHAS